MVLVGSYGGGRFLMSEVPLYPTEPAPQAGALHHDARTSFISSPLWTPSVYRRHKFSKDSLSITVPCVRDQLLENFRYDLVVLDLPDCRLGKPLSTAELKTVRSKTFYGLDNLSGGIDLRILKYTR